MMAVEAKDDKLRASLHQVFNQFDTDGSGLISMDELESILKLAKIDQDPTKLARMMREADTDGSGEIDFEEFYWSLKAQLEAGGGSSSGLLSVVSVFDWFNPLKWFAAESQSTEGTSESHGTGAGTSSPGPSQESTALQRRSPVKPRLDVVAARNGADAKEKEEEMQRRSQRAATVRTTRAVYSECELRKANAQMAEEQRQAERQMRDFVLDQHKLFLERQRIRIAATTQQKLDVLRAIEAHNQVKRETGSEMRIAVQAAYQQVQQANHAYVKKQAGVALHARRVKKAATAARKEEEKRNATVIACKAQVERQQRREDALATVRKQEREAREFAERVKFETRPEVRELTRDYFQARRDAVYAEEKNRQHVNHFVRSEQRNTFLQKQGEVVAQIRAIDTIGTQRKIHEKKHNEADEVREQLRNEFDRKHHSDLMHWREVESHHDTMMQARFDPDGSPVDMRETFRARSRSWNNPPGQRQDSYRIQSESFRDPLHEA